MEKIAPLLEKSSEVIRDCCLRNGAIVAANSAKPYFPKEAKNYRFVWPRDAAYICMAADLLGMAVQERFFRWCATAQDFEETGLFYEKYHINGTKAGAHFQPDQTGTLLFAIHEHYQRREIPDDILRLVMRAAHGLCAVWEKDHFTPVTQDVWEERLCFPDLKENFTYSLAACHGGLLCANALVPHKKWLSVAHEMKNALVKVKIPSFYRSTGTLNDARIDASLLGLVWPFQCVKADEERMISTVEAMEERIVTNFGVHRYEHDEYDGWMYEGIHRKKGAGYWPLLNFWMALYWAERGDRGKALTYFNKALDDVPQNNFIPEQIFHNTIQVSVSPLGWSHAMFVIASKKLGFF